MNAANALNTNAKDAGIVIVHINKNILRGLGGGCVMMVFNIE